jgi:hypothetical protein
LDAVEINTNSLRLYVRKNHATSIRTLVGIAGDYLRITDNCVTRVQHVQEFRQNGGSHVVIAPNGHC